MPEKSWVEDCVLTPEDRSVAVRSSALDALDRQTPSPLTSVPRLLPSTVVGLRQIPTPLSLKEKEGETEVARAGVDDRRKESQEAEGVTTTTGEAGARELAKGRALSL